MLSNESFGGIGMPTFLVTNARQHKPEDLAGFVAKEIFDATQIVDAARAIEAEAVQSMIVKVITPFVQTAIDYEREWLNQFEDQCAKDYAVLAHVEAAIAAIHALPDHLWSKKLKSDEWVNAAKLAIGNILVTAIHVERSWFAVDHPENEAAQTYTYKFTGQ